MRTVTHSDALARFGYALSDAQFSAKDPETREKAALRFIAISFFALAA
jgi:uncharacterized protein YifE (UPF0438 family)